MDNPAPTLKWCSQCKAYHPLGRFVRSGLLKSGKVRYRSACKDSLPERARRTAGRNRRRGLAAVPAWVIQMLLTRQHYLCACGCGQSIRFSYHVDHIKPLAKGGLHVWGNLQLLTPPCNLKKGAKV